MRGFRGQGSGFGIKGAVAACCLLAVGCMVLVGCGGSKLDTVTVTGRVTYGGGDWPKPGTIDFTPKEAAKGNLHPGTAQFGTDGHFTVKSGQASGLVPGTYAIRIDCWETPPSMENPSAGKSYVPEKYRNAATSGLTLEIKPGDSKKEFTADIPKQ
jgi:hypothetical protein